MTAAEICDETRVFPKLNWLTNPSLVDLDMQIVMPRGELQVHVANDNRILRDVPQHVHPQTHQSLLQHRKTPHYATHQQTPTLKN